MILNSPYSDEEQVIYEGELINELFWNGEFYSVNNSGNKTSLGKIKEGNGKIKTYWDFKEFEGEGRNGIFWRGHLKEFNLEGKIKKEMGKNMKEKNIKMEY